MTGFSTGSDRSESKRGLRNKGVMVLVVGVGLILLLALGALLVAALQSEAPDAAEVLEELKEQGLPVGQSEVYTAENDPNELLGRPGQYTGKASFKDTRLPPDELAGDSSDVANGGSVETFDNEDDAIKRQEYLETVTQGVPMFAEYAYRNDTVLLRLSKRLTPDQASDYEAALHEAF